MINKNDLISRQAAIQEILDLPNCPDGYSDTYDKQCIIDTLEEVPAAEVVEVVRYKDCIWRDGSVCRNNDTMPWSDDDFCSLAERIDK